MNRGMHKYNKITKKQVLELFKEKSMINRAYICERLGCSVYSTRIAVEDLIDDGVIRLSNRGYVKTVSL